MLPALDAAPQGLHLIQLTPDGILATLQMLQPTKSDTLRLFTAKPKSVYVEPAYTLSNEVWTPIRWWIVVSTY